MILEFQESWKMISPLILVKKKFLENDLNFDLGQQILDLDWNLLLGPRTLWISILCTYQMDIADKNR